VVVRLLVIFVVLVVLIVLILSPVDGTAIVLILSLGRKFEAGSEGSRSLGPKMATEEEWKLSSISFSLMPPADLRDQDEMCVESGTLDKERLRQQFCVDIGSMPSALTSTSARRCLCRRSI
jgi:hypothetical protein